MRRGLNPNTQPFLEMPVFQNWEVVAEGWYFACRSDEVKAGEVRSMNLCGQHVAIFRGEDGTVRALDGFCPHMGTDLGIGKVRGDRIACFFHHWEFDGAGRCQRIPCGETPPVQARLQAYAVSERFGAIWVFPREEASFPVPEFKEFPGAEVSVSFSAPYTRTCHHHVTMINGIDAQHLRSVHGFEIEMNLRFEESGPDLMDFSLDGQFPASWKTRVTGQAYGYSMRYSAGTMGLLTILRNVRLFGKFPLPTLHMIFAYRPVRFGETLVQPIYVTRKREGFWGGLIDRLLLTMTKRAFYVLKDEDGKIYDNMRFNPVSLLKMDRAIQIFIDRINRLKPSIWSRS